MSGDPLERIRRAAASTAARVAFAEAEDARVREAAARLAGDGLKPLLVSAGAPSGTDGVESLDVADREWADRIAGALADRARLRALPADELRRRASDPLVAACALLLLGEVDAVVAGATRASADVVRAGLAVVGLAPDTTLVSSAFLMVLPDGAPARALGRRAFVFADCGVIPEPGPQALADIALAAAKRCRTLLGEEPRVAFLSFSTRGSAGGAGPERVREALALARAREPQLCADGELQADAALLPDVAARKAPGSCLEGRANVLVFPSLDAGNVAYKLIERMAGARAVGPLLMGLARPLHDLSRGASVEDIALVASIGALEARAAGPAPEAAAPAPARSGEAR